MFLGLEPPWRCNSNYIQIHSVQKESEQLWNAIRTHLQNGNLDVLTPNHFVGNTCVNIWLSLDHGENHDGSYAGIVGYVSLSYCNLMLLDVGGKKI